MPQAASSVRHRVWPHAFHAAARGKPRLSSAMDGFAPSIFFLEKKQKREVKDGGEKVAIYHLEAKVISRGTGRSAVAASAYMSCSRMYNDYDGIQHNYTRKQGLVWQEVFLPPMAPPEWADRQTLWNAVEEAEKTKDSRLAREFVVALPVELGRNEWIGLLTDFIQSNFVNDGMCADVAIHDTDGHNPHAHILLTVRPLKENSTWQQKTEKEYLCVRGDEERGFTAAEFKAAQSEGWEKQYQYKIGKKKVYMTPSVAETQGLERASKYPKSTKFGRQNPITARWNSEEQLVLWRAAWADIVNRYLERSGREERIDHRSHAERGLDEQPTIHEGVAARALEKKGIVSNRCELNRQIKADNTLLRTLKAQVKKLTELVKGGVAAIAEAMENLRQKMIVFRYQVLHIGAERSRISDTLQTVQPDLKKYENIVKLLRVKHTERKTLMEEKSVVPMLRVLRHRELAQKIAALTKDIEELKNEKALLLHQFECIDVRDMETVKQRVTSMEASLQKLDRQEEKYADNLNTALVQFGELRQQAESVDSDELQIARQTIRLEKESTAAQRLQAAHGKRFDSRTLAQSRKDVAGLLSETADPVSIRQQLQRTHIYQKSEQNHKTRSQER